MKRIERIGVLIVILVLFYLFYEVGYYRGRVDMGLKALEVLEEYRSKGK